MKILGAFLIGARDKRARGDTRREREVFYQPINCLNLIYCFPRRVLLSTHTNRNLHAANSQSVCTNFIDPSCFLETSAFYDRQTTHGRLMSVRRELFFRQIPSRWCCFYVPPQAATRLNSAREIILNETFAFHLYLFLSALCVCVCVCCSAYANYFNLPQ